MTLLTVGARRRSTWNGEWVDNQQPYTFPASTPYTVPTQYPAITPTYEGSGQAMHPDVLDFRQILGRPWHGWRYWMAMTPYPGSDQAYENPSILVSQDGYNWQVPAGGSNPVYPPPGSGWSSDTDLTYDPSTDELVLCYRPIPTTLAVGRSANGVTWSSLTYATRAPLPEGITEAVSPALIRMPDGTWRAWVNGVGPNWSNNLLAYTMAEPGNWGAPVACTGVSVWHPDVIYHLGKFWLIGGGVVASSLDGVNWVTNPTPVVPTVQWEISPYRSTIQPHENGTHMRVWYSGDVGNQVPVVWRTFYTQIPLTEWPTP